MVEGITVAMTINELVQVSHDIALEHGWWSDRQEPYRSIADEKAFPEKLMLVVSECSEALEDFRNSRPLEFVIPGENGKPTGIPIELADIVIRVADMAGRYGIDLAHAIALKTEYNRTRPFKHGGKRL